MSNIEALKTKTEGKIKEYGAEIDVLQAKAEQAGADMQFKLRNKISDLREKLSESQRKLDQLEQSSGGVVTELHAGVEKACGDLAEAVDAARERKN